MTMVRMRPASSDTVSEVLGLIRRWATHWQVEPPMTRARMTRVFASPGFNPFLDTRAQWDNDRLIAFGLVEHTPPTSSQDEVLIFGLVDPSYRHNGIGRSLLAWQVGRARELLAESEPRSRREVRVVTSADVANHRRLYVRYGFHPRPGESGQTVYVLNLPTH